MNYSLNSYRRNTTFAVNLIWFWLFSVSHFEMFEIVRNYDLLFHRSCSAKSIRNIASYGIPDEYLSSQIIAFVNVQQWNYLS